MKYDLEKWQLRVWTRDSRYYIGEVKQDLFGDWMCRRRWGSRFSRRGNSSTHYASDYESAVALLEATGKRRQARGYTAIDP